MPPEPVPSDYPTIVKELHDAQVELEQLESVERHEAEVERGIETLKEVQRTLEEIAKDAEGTQKQIKEYQDQLKDAIEKLELVNEEIATALKEETKPLVDAGGKVREGVGQFGEAAGEVSNTLKEISDRLDQVKELIDLGEKPASEILEGFAEYFEDLLDLLGPLAERFPGLGAFVTIWVEAIRRIQGSIAQIESIQATREAQLRDITGRDMYVGGEGPLAIRRRRIEELRERVDVLRDAAAAHPDAPTPPPSGQTIVLQHEKDFELARRAVEGDGPTLHQLKQEADDAARAAQEARTELATWEREAARTPDRRSRAEVEAEREQIHSAMRSTTDPAEQRRLQDRMAAVQQELNAFDETAAADQRSAQHGQKLRNTLATAEWHAANAKARLDDLLRRIREWLTNDLRARGPSSTNPQWSEGDHERFNRDHPEIPITPEDVQAPVGTPVATGIPAMAGGGLAGAAVPARARDGRRQALAAGGLLLVVAVAIGAAVILGGQQSRGTAGGDPTGGPRTTGPVASASAPSVTGPGTVGTDQPRASAAPVTPQPPALGGSFDSLTAHGVWPADRASRLDRTADIIYSNPAQDPGHRPDYVDILDNGGAVIDASQEVVDAAFKRIHVRLQRAH